MVAYRKLALLGTMRCAGFFAMGGELLVVVEVKERAVEEKETREDKRARMRSVRRPFNSFRGF